MFDLSDRVALVTGSTRGIGLAIARQLIEHGARVTISSRSQADCERVADELNHAAGGTVAWACSFDLADHRSVESMVNAAVARWGCLDILVAGSYMTAAGRAGQTEPALFAEVLRVNVVQNSVLAHRALPALKASDHARVVFIGSASGLAGSPDFAAYGTAKAALHYLTRTLAVEWGRYGVRVNALVPGRTETATAAKYAETAQQAKSISQWPINRVATPDEIAAGAVYLSSPGAAYTTGALLVCDGGRSQVVPH